MRKYILHILLLVAISFASCADDNYAEPNAGVAGTFIDATTLEAVPMPVQGSNGVRIKMFEKDRLHSTGSDYSEAFVAVYSKVDGTYENAWMFKNNYLMTFDQENFYPVDTLEVNVSGGNTMQDVKVIPYSRISIEEHSLENNILKASYTISRDKAEYEIKSRFFIWNISPYIDNVTGNYKGMVKIDESATDDNTILNIKLTQEIDLSVSDEFNKVENRTIIKSNNNLIYVRVGVETNGRANYSKVIPVKVTF